MIVRPGRSSVRRGLVVAADGLAIWLLAVVLAAYTEAGSVAGSGSGLLATTLDATRRWATTPGVGGLELLAYGGLAVAALGPLWYWLVRPWARRPPPTGPLSVFGPPGDGFRYDQPESSNGDTGRPSGSDRGRLARSSAGAATRGNGAGLSRVAELFEPTPEGGDFLRGGAGRSADGPERVAEAVDRTDDGRSDRDTARTDELLVGMDDSDETGDVELTVRTDGDAGRTDPAGAEAAGEDAARESAGVVEGEDPADEAPDDAAGRPVPGPVAAAGPAAQQAGDGDGDEASAGRRAEPLASIVDLGPAVAASRARLDAVADRLDAAASGADLEPVAADLAAIASAADGTLEPLRTAVGPAEALPIERRLPAVRADGRRIESAFDVARRGE